MSLRALGQQFKDFMRPPFKDWQHPRAEGRLFDPGPPPRRPTFGPDYLEAGRRRAAGEANPDAPWDVPFLQHHFLQRPEPVQGKLF